ncbi:hypothetical protein N9O71_00930 [bacterium]|nr:hypothetical protein [bacterium]
MPDLVVNVQYEFNLSAHARTMLAFRHAYLTESYSIEGFYGGLTTNRRKTRQLHSLILPRGKKVPAILDGLSVVTIFPNSNVMDTREASEIVHCIEAANLAADGELFPLADIIELNKRFQQEQGGFKVADLRREIKARTKNKGQAFHALIIENAHLKVQNEELEEENLTLQAHISSLDEKIELIKKIDPIAETPKAATKPATATPSGKVDKATFGISGNAKLVNRTAYNKPVYKFSNCEILEVVIAEAGSSDWHEVVFRQGKKIRVLSSKYKKYVEKYRPGDTEIFTVYMGKRHFVHHKLLTRAQLEEKAKERLEGEKT